MYSMRYLGMTFQVSIGFSALENTDGKENQSKTYALFIGDTVLVNEVNSNDFSSILNPIDVVIQNEPCTVYTTSKKDLNHIAIILNDDAEDDEKVDDTPAVAPRRAAAVDKNRVGDFVEFQSVCFSRMFIAFRRMQRQPKNHGKIFKRIF